MTATLSIVIPTRNRREKVLRLLASLYAGSLPSGTEIVVVADDCTDGTSEAIHDRFSDVVIVDTEPDSSTGAPRPPHGSAIARASGADASRGSLILFIDDDNVVEPDCVSILMNAMCSRPEIGALGPLMLDDPAGQSIWCAGAMITRWGTVDNRAGACLPVDPRLPGLTTACDFLPNSFLTRRSLLGLVPFDVATFPHNWSEGDWALRVKQLGYEIRVALDARTWHDHGYPPGSRVTRINPDWIQDQARSRVLAQRRFPASLGSWHRYVLLVMPAATVYYAFSCFRQRLPLRLLWPYLAGLREGLRSPSPDS